MKSSIGALFISAVVCAAQTGNVAISYNGSSGLTAVQYNGFQYLASGKFVVGAVNFVSSGGQVSPGSTSGTTTYDAAHLQTTTNFSWGSVAVVYATAGNKLSLTITTTNTSSQTIQGLFLEPLDVQFPSTPQEFDGVDPILGLNMGNPTALRMTAGSNALVLTNDDVVLPLLVGFPWSYNKPASTVFPIKVETSQDSMLPNSLPFVNRPIAPGASDTYQISLRFGAASATNKSLVSDLYQTFATTYPFTLKWTDRRPIGQLIIGTSAAGWPTNPRGWFSDPSVNVTTPQGIAAFQARLLSWGKNAVTILKSMNAQGMVTWDIEGEQYPQPTTYIGDPTQFATLAPEMAAVIDQYFKLFTDAGLRVGVCIRPQQLVIPGGGGAPTQTTVADPTQLLMNKVAYAYNRWGATLFYIDSNGDPNYPMSSTFFQKVAAAYPQVLLMPEHQTDAYYAFSAPYDELKGGVSATPQSVLDVYPSAFSNIYIPDGNFTQNAGTLQNAIKRGDLMMFRGWFADSFNQQLLNLYPLNGVAPPAPLLATPASGSTVAGTVNLTSSVTAGALPVSSVQYVVDGVNSGSVVTSAPYTHSLDTTSLSAGLHNIQVVASDTIGDLGFASSDIFVGTQGPQPPPSVQITSPANGTTVAGSVLINSQVTASLPLQSVQWTLDGAQLGSMSAGPYQYSWNTVLTANGSHTIAVIATDTAGNSGRASIGILVQNALPDFSLSSASSNIGIVAGGMATDSISVAPANGFSGAVALAVSGLPAGVSGSFSPASLGAGTSTLTLSGTASAVPGSYSITVTGSSGSLSHQVALTLNVSSAPSGGSLSGTVSAPTAVQDLTAAGTADWIHWGLNGSSGVDRNVNGQSQISNFTRVGGNTTWAYANNPFAFSWSNGSPTATASTATGLFVIGQGNGFAITAPADTTQRVLTVYAGVYKAQATLVAKLSDGSATVYSDASVVNMGGQLSVAYTLTYKAASAGQTLSVTLTQSSSNGDLFNNVTLQAATLATVVGQSSGALTGSVTFPHSTQNLTALGTADWEQWNTPGAGGFNRKSGVTPQLTKYTVIGTSPVLAYSNNPFGFSWTDGSPIASMSNVATGAFTIGQGTGFQIAAPADMNWRTLTVFAGVYKSQGKLTATLSDGSAPVYTDTSVSSATGSISAGYVLHYRAGSPGQTLTVTYTQANPNVDGSSNVTLQAAALQNQ